MGKYWGLDPQRICLDRLSSQVTIKKTLYPSSKQEENWASTLIKACLIITEDHKVNQPLTAPCASGKRVSCGCSGKMSQKSSSGFQLGVLAEDSQSSCWVCPTPSVASPTAETMPCRSFPRVSVLPTLSWKPSPMHCLPREMQEYGDPPHKSLILLPSGTQRHPSVHQSCELVPQTSVNTTKLDLYANEAEDKALTIILDPLGMHPWVVPQFHINH